MSSSVIFRTEIHRTRVNKPLNWFKSLKEQCLTLRQIDEDGVRWSKKNYPFGYTSYGSQDDLHLRFSDLVELAGKIEKEARVFAKNLKWKTPLHSLKVSNMWVNIMEAGAHHSGHIHPDAAISGTFYVDIPKGSPGLQFENPSFPLFAFLKTGVDLENAYHNAEVESGDLILFPSYLRHGVRGHNALKPRISISFNLNFA